jgi:hypothetical protein
MELDSWASDSDDSSDEEEEKENFGYKEYQEKKVPFCESCPLRTLSQSLLYY